jgi:hypothetical protein
MYLHKDLHVIVPRARSDHLAKWHPAPVEAVLRAQAKTILDGPLESVGTFTEIRL